MVNLVGQFPHVYTSYLNDCFSDSSRRVGQWLPLAKVACFGRGWGRDDHFLFLGIANLSLNPSKRADYTWYLAWPKKSGIAS